MNSTRVNNTRILIFPVLFELKDRETCNALPNVAVLGALNLAQIQLHARRSEAMKEVKITTNVTVSMDIPKLTATNNYGTFIASFTSLESQIKSYSGPTLDYLIREANENYDGPRQASRATCLQGYAKFDGPAFI